MGTGVLSPGLKRGQGVTLTTHPHMLPRSIMSINYTSSPPNAFVACNGTALSLVYYYYYYYDYDYDYYSSLAQHF
jgi:hypothetical protein